VEGSTEKAVSVKVDSDFCAASAVCTRIAPKVFEIPEGSDVAVVLTNPVTDPEQIALVNDAEQSCPTASISVQRS
jgi:ferredoxin